MSKDICALFAAVVLLVVTALFDEQGVVPRLADPTYEPAPVQQSEEAAIGSPASSDGLVAPTGHASDPEPAPVASFPAVRIE